MVDYVTLATLAPHRDWHTYATQHREGRGIRYARPVPATGGLGSSASECLARQY